MHSIISKIGEVNKKKTSVIAEKCYMVEEATQEIVELKGIQQKIKHIEKKINLLKKEKTESKTLYQKQREQYQNQLQTQNLNRQTQKPSSRNSTRNMAQQAQDDHIYLD